MIPETDKKFYNIEIAINEIGSNTHKELNPEYVKKLNNIERRKKVSFQENKRIR